MMDVYSSKQVADMLLERTLCVYDKRPWEHVGDQLDVQQLVSTKAMTWAQVHLQSLCLAGVLAYRHTHLSVSTVCCCKICTCNLCVNAYITTPGRKSNPYTYKCIHTSIGVHTSV